MGHDISKHIYNTKYKNSERFEISGILKISFNYDHILCFVYLFTCNKHRNRDLCFVYLFICNKDRNRDFRSGDQFFRKANNL